MLTRALAHYAGAYQNLGRIDDSDRWAERLIELGESSGYTFAAAVGHEYLAENANFCGFFVRGAKEAGLDNQLGARIGSLDRVGWSQMSLCWALAGLGDLVQAERAARDGLDIADRIGDVRLAIWLESNLLTVLSDRARFDEALAHVPGLVARADGMAQVALQTIARFAAAYVSLRKDDPATALGYLREAERLLEPTQGNNARVFIGGQIGEALVRLGKMDEAEADGQAHLELARTIGAPREQVRALRVLADVALARGDATKALELANQALALHRDRADPIEQGRSLVLRSAILLRLGDTEAARKDLEEAIGLFARVGVVPDEEQARQRMKDFPRA